MPQVVIENPVVNSPYEEPKRHFFFSGGGITDKIVEARRLSSYFIPIPRPKKKGKQLAFETEWIEERKKDNEFINALRGSVAKWRFGRYPGVTRISRQLLEYWQQPNRDRRLYFCQIEALETAIYLAEAAEKQDGKWILQELRRANAEEGNSPLYRIAFKMATGSGKTVVMGMLIAWQTLNKLADPKDDRFSDAFLVVTPGITIRDRLRVLFPNDPDNYYRKLDLLPEGQRRPLPQALESMDEVASYFKNHNAGFTIPHTLNGEEHSYLPDFVARLPTPGGPLNLILEVTGQRRAEKAVKVATARTLWVPAVNDQGGFGRWAFLEIRDPWNAQTAIREFLDNGVGGRS